MKKLIYFLSSTFLATMLFMNVTVMGQNPFTIDVLQPDDTSIDWVIGETYTISWTDNLSQPVVVRLWNPFAVPAAFEVLAASVTGTTWVWDMLNTYTAGAGYYIQVGSTLGSTYDNNGATFDLIYAPANSITVIQPSVLNISWARGTSHLITWTDNIDEPVDILLSADGGGTYPTTLASDLTGTTWVWSIPSGQAVGTNYKIKVESSDFTSVNDVSNEVFAITATTGDFVAIYQPLDATSWARNTTHVISWKDNLTEPVDIFYEKISGGGEVPITTNVIGSTYVWTIPIGLAAGADYTIILKSSLDPAVEITSDQFDITVTTGGITAIYQPLATTSWTLGTTHLISWLDNLEEPVDIFYVGIIPVVAEAQIGNDILGSTFVWNMTTAPAVAAIGTYQIIIKSSLDATNTGTSGTFTITASSGTMVQVIQPSVAGISWAQDYDYYISWDNDFPENVKIDLVKYTDAAALPGVPMGLPIEIVDATPGVAGSTYVWDIVSGTYPAHGFYRVRVTSINDALLTDESNATFAITLSAGTDIDVIQPNGGEVWMAGTSHLITWLDDCPENVIIELYKGGVLVAAGNSGIPGTSVSGTTYTWNIPSGLTAAADYKIKIISSLDATLFGESANNFTIVPFGKSASSNISLDGGIASAISIYPNPANGQFTVSSPVSINKVEVRNLLGQVLYSTNVGFAVTSVDISSYDAGMYIVNIIIEGEVVTKKLFVQ